MPGLMDYCPAGATSLQLITATDCTALSSESLPNHPSAHHWCMSVTKRHPNGHRHTMSPVGATTCVCSAIPHKNPGPYQWSMTAHRQRNTWHTPPRAQSRRQPKTAINQHQLNCVNVTTSTLHRPIPQCSSLSVSAAPCFKVCCRSQQAESTNPT